jgi:hypothetical protein
MISLFILFYLLYSLGVCVYFFEKYQWNHGISRYDGSRWKRLRSDDEGNNIYKDASGNIIFISWPSIEKERRRYYFTNS